MRDNVSPVDQWIRIIVGGAGMWEYLLDPDQGRIWLFVFSAFFFLSGVIGSCPLYSLIGVGTKRGATPSRATNSNDHPSSSGTHGH